MTTTPPVHGVLDLVVDGEPGERIEPTGETPHPRLAIGPRPQPRCPPLPRQPGVGIVAAVGDLDALHLTTHPFGEVIRRHHRRGVFELSSDLGESRALVVVVQRRQPASERVDMSGGDSTLGQRLREPRHRVQRRRSINQMIRLLR